MTEPAEVLTAERLRRRARLDALQRMFDAMVAASEGSNADDEHDPEGATIAFERSQLMTQLAQARADVLEADQALARVRAGSYGRCETCGEPIAAQRLAARPTATRCMSCAGRGIDARTRRS